MIKVLSVDWDYFFPDPTYYDWGSHEENPMCYELLWHTRTGSKNQKGELAVDHYNPTGTETFWDQVLDTEYLSYVLVAESHRNCHDLIRQLRGVHLTNFDAHHDYGYQQKKKLDCSNWVYFCKKKKIVSEYRLIYPAWRKEITESDKKHKFEILYEIPKKEEYNVVFVCRSPCWTPPWADDKWTAFINNLKSRCHKNVKFENVANIVRKLNMEQAKQEAAEYTSMIERFYKKNQEVKHGDRLRPCSQA